MMLAIKGYFIYGNRKVQINCENVINYIFKGLVMGVLIIEKEEGDNFVISCCSEEQIG